MKNKIILLCSIISLLFLSCTNNEKFTGSPEGKLTFENVTGTISTIVNFALPGQEIEFNATLPESFRSQVPGEVTLEASAFSIGGGIRKANVVIPAGQNSALGKIVIGGGGGLFENDITIKLTAISIKEGVIGKQFTVNSNDLIIPSGATSIPTENSKKMKISVFWEDKLIPNKIVCKFSRKSSIAVTLKNPVAGSTNIKINGVNYPVTFTTDLTTSATNFVNDNLTKPLLIAAGIQLQSNSSSIYINYTGTKPVVVVTSSNINFSSTKFDEIIMQTDGSDFSKFFDFYSSEIISSNNNKPKAEAADYAFNQGDYSIKFGVNLDSDLETVGANLKYRIVIRLPNGDVKIFPGVYQNISAAAGFKEILTFKKSAYGSAADFNQFLSF